MANMTLREILLGLAGRVDDDALAGARELLAVGDDGEALELVTGSLLAGGVPLSAREVGGLRALLAEQRMDTAVGDALGGLLSESELPRHRFVPRVVEDAAVDDPPELSFDAVVGVAARRAGARRIWRTWRVTPAGTAPGPVPYRVLLVEVTEDAAPEVICYHIADAVARTGETAAVEAFRSSDQVPAYHIAALEAAELIYRADQDVGTGDAAVGGVSTEPERAGDRPGVAQLSDTEREMLGLLHDELRRREGEGGVTTGGDSADTGDWFGARSRATGGSRPDAEPTPDTVAFTNGVPLSSAPDPDTDVTAGHEGEYEGDR